MVGGGRNGGRARARGHPQGEAAWPGTARPGGPAGEGVSDEAVTRRLLAGLCAAILLAWRLIVHWIGGPGAYLTIYGVTIKLSL